MLVKQITDWLNKTGFPLEMEAASAFRDAGFDVRQSATYADPQSDKGREIDVLAMDPDLIGIIDISFVVECKSSTKPWVVFTSDDALRNYNRLFAFIRPAMCLTSLLRRSSLATTTIRPSFEARWVLQGEGGEPDTPTSSYSATTFHPCCLAVILTYSRWASKPRPDSTCPLVDTRKYATTSMLVTP